jgi:tetratricopeptide (TPR) repeat protein
MEPMRGEGLDEGPPVAVDTVEAATYRLCRLYSTRRPSELLPRVQAQLRAGSDLLKNGVRLRDHARLLATAGWQHLLLAALHYDLGQYKAGRACREAALSIGREVADPDIIGWSYETAAWFAIFEGVPPDVLEAAEEGSRQAPEISSARVMNILKVAVGWARMGRPLEAQRAIEDAVEVNARLPAPQHPDHHFVFDPPKLDLYLSRTYAWLKMPDKAEYHARRVIAQFGSRSDDPRHVYPVPTRASMGRLDLASALLERGDLDEAARIAGQAFGPIIRHDVLRRAAEIDARLRQADPNATDVRTFHERYIEAWRSLGGQ